MSFKGSILKAGVGLGTLAVASQFLIASPLSLKYRPDSIQVRPLGSLKNVPIPGPSDQILSQFVKDKKAAVQLGKALFWEMRVGSDNKTACASCHFHAGSDNRVKNNLNPGLLATDSTFQIGHPNYELKPTDFPLVLAPDNLNNNDISTSQGVILSEFKEIYHDQQETADACKVVEDAVFHGLTHTGKQINTRQTEDRHTPAAINAVFNFRNFWDGRAFPYFNGVDPFGVRNQGAYVWKYDNGNLVQETIAIPLSSLASQAVAPPLSTVEMSCINRRFFHIAKKLLRTPILAHQTISRHDSVLGYLATNRPTYKELIKRAFQPQWWAAEGPVPSVSATGSMDLRRSIISKEVKLTEQVSQMEGNFSLFYGLALQLYQATLVSDDSPFDRYMDGDLTALTEQQIRGKVIFESPAKGDCLRCHDGAEFTQASVASAAIRRSISVATPPGIYIDNGFHGIGVRPVAEDRGVTGLDPWGRTLSETALIKTGQTQWLGPDFDPTQNPTPAQINIQATAGSFKVSGLRNVELTGPYFHNGGKSTLMQVVDFYVRDGDFASGAINPLTLNQQEKEDLVAFMLSLTDERVKYKKAPFDHPSLCFPHGHKGHDTVLIESRDVRGAASDIMECLPAVGRDGVGQGLALKPFMDLDPFSM